MLNFLDIKRHTCIDKKERIVKNCTWRFKGMKTGDAYFRGTSRKGKDEDRRCERENERGDDMSCDSTCVWRNEQISISRFNFPRWPGKTGWPLPISTTLFSNRATEKKKKTTSRPPLTRFSAGALRIFPAVYLNDIMSASLFHLD